MNIKQVATFKPETSIDIAALIELTNGRVISIPHIALTTLNTPAKLKTEFERQAGQTLDDIFFYFNQDGTLAIATGEEPTVWPEDEKE